MKKRQIDEAVKRMEKLQLSKNLILDFIKEQKIGFSFLTKIGIFVLDSLTKNYEKIVKEWEKKTGNIVYYVIYRHMDCGEMLTFFYVSKYEEEWKQDMEMLDENVAIAYVKNLTYDDCSEYGSVGFEEFHGGLVRTY